jgi:hypothetical protein
MLVGFRLHRPPSPSTARAGLSIVHRLPRRMAPSTVDCHITLSPSRHRDDQRAPRCSPWLARKHDSGDAGFWEGKEEPGSCSSPETMVREGESEDEDEDEDGRLDESEAGRARAREQRQPGKKEKRRKRRVKSGQENRELEQGARRCTLTGFFALGLQRAQAQVPSPSPALCTYSTWWYICQVQLLRYRLR